MVSAIVTTGSKPYIVEDRPMLSRSSGDRGEETLMLCPYMIQIEYYMISTVVIQLVSYSNYDFCLSCLSLSILSSHYNHLNLAIHPLQMQYK